MPATSEAQRRFFGMVLAYKRGRMKGASKQVKKAASSISEKGATDFASRETKKRESLAKSITR